ncbi:MAG: hypothetical protein M1828_001336 [Chrysothrix sp. TS-e1954]|nr:MAG: hypothetical protein M1828_001336 [Chrysothrix sp. TS-e1954]
MSKSHDVKPFSRALAEAYPVLVRLHQDLDIIKKSHRLLKPREVSHTPDMVSLMSLLPAKARALELLRIYMDYIEPSYLVINKCVFYRQLAGLWPENVTANSPVSANFIAQFLLVMACALSIVDLQEPTAISGMAKARRPQALLWIQESEKWLHDDGPGKSDADHFRVQCLVVLAKKIHHLQHQHCWLATSALVQAAMMAGYNRDPSGHHKISYLAIENRWRLWRTILRLHLEACFALGMPPSVLVNEWDKDPDNIGKAMLDRLYGPSPNPYYVDGPTLLNAEQSLYEPLSLHLQLLVAHAMNDPHLQCTPTYNETLRTSLRELHSILRESTLPSSEQAATHWTQIQPYCQLQICRLELALSAPSPDNGDPASDGIWQAVYDSSFELLGVFLESTHKAEEPHHRQTLLCTMWTPIVQSCKGLLASLPVASNDAHHHKPRSPQARHATTAFDRIEATLAHLEPQAIVDLKRTKDLCHLLTYYAYIRCRLAASALEKARIEKETVDRIAGVSYKIVANHTSSSQFDAGGGPAAQHGLGDGEQGVNFVLDEGFQWDNYLGDFAWS